jgi:hypothetical protein
VPEPEEKSVTISARLLPEQQYAWDLFVLFLNEVAVQPQYLDLNLRVG